MGMKTAGFFMALISGFLFSTRFWLNPSGVWRDVLYTIQNSDLLNAIFIGVFFLGLFLIFMGSRARKYPPR